MDLKQLGYFLLMEKLEKRRNIINDSDEETIMIIALDHNKERISINNAVAKTEYYCPICTSPVIAKVNGKIRKPHFAHAIGSDCDWGDVSDWHIEWQEQFPIDCREVVMENKGERHRADVFIKRLNTVIEFQHSPISFDDFNKRNKFYTECGYKLVWIFDASERIQHIYYTIDKTSLDSLSFDALNNNYYLEWKRKNVAFIEYEKINHGKPINILLEYKLSNGEKHYFLKTNFSEKRIVAYGFCEPIHRENVLKSFGAISDPSIKSIMQLYKETDNFVKAETKRRKEEIEENLRRWEEEEREHFFQYHRETKRQKRHNENVWYDVIKNAHEFFENHPNNRKIEGRD